MLLLLVTAACAQNPQPNRAADLDVAEPPDIRANQSVPEDISRNLAPLLAAESPAEFRRLAAKRGYSAGPKGVLVDVQTQGLTAADRARFEIEGVTVDAFSVKYQRVSAIVHDAAALRALAALPVVRYIAPAYGAVDRSGGQSITY